MITSEADIKTSLYSDKFLVMNLVKGKDYYNIRYQIKPFMIWIWISITLLAIGGIFNFLKKIR
jgi:Cytochrome c biogenesis factor